MRHRFIFLGAGVVMCAMAMPVRAQDTGSMDRAGTTGSPATQPSGMTGDRMTGDRATGDQNAMAPDAKDIRGMLKDATEAGIKKKGFDNLVRRFVDADRNRIGKNNLTDADWDKLNGRVDQFQKDWKAKYNQDFDIDHPEMVFNDQFRIVQGTIGEAQPAGSRMGDGSAMDPGMPDTNPGPQADKTAGGDVNREPGRKVAKVTFPASHGMPAVYVPLIREFPDAWKIDVPDQVDGRKLYDNLLTHLTMLDEHKDMWPADVNDAYRAVSHHVLMAIMDKSADMKPDMTKPGDMPKDHTMPGDRTDTDNSRGTGGTTGGNGTGR